MYPFTSAAPQQLNTYQLGVAQSRSSNLIPAISADYPFNQNSQLNLGYKIPQSDQNPWQRRSGTPIIPSDSALANVLLSKSSFVQPPNPKPTPSRYLQERPPPPVLPPPQRKKQTASYETDDTTSYNDSVFDEFEKNSSLLERRHARSHFISTAFTDTQQWLQNQQQVNNDTSRDPHRNENQSAREPYHSQIEDAAWASHFEAQQKLERGEDERYSDFSEQFISTETTGPRLASDTIESDTSHIHQTHQQFQQNLRHPLKDSKAIIGKSSAQSLCNISSTPNVEKVSKQSSTESQETKVFINQDNVTRLPPEEEHRKPNLIPYLVSIHLL